MPTPSEQKALAFVAIVMLLGGAVRVLRAGPTAPTPAEQQGLAVQASAADSASRNARKGKAARPRKGGRSVADTFPRVVGGVASVPPSYARPDQPYDHLPYGAPRTAGNAPVPSPRIDTDANGARPSAAAAVATGRQKAPAGTVDLDHASAIEIETLPRVGPATAQRIVANRDSLGPFGSLAGLRRVKGMGPASLARLAPYVTFGGRPAGKPNPP